MWWPSLLCFISALLVSITGILRYINIFKQPPYLSIPLIISIFLPISIIYLLPSDYVSTSSVSELPKWFELPANVILIMWRCNYWVTFAMTWLILPMLQEFFRSGNYKTSKKLWDSFRVNLKFQMIMLGVSLMGLLYLIISVKLSPDKIKLLVIALSHIYALIIALWLMSHGLIDIPRRKWQKGSLSGYLESLYLKLPKLNEDLEEAKTDFRENVLKVLALEAHVSELQYRDWIFSLINDIPEETYNRIKQTQQQIPPIARSELTDAFLVSLSSSFKFHLSQLIAYESEHNKLIKEIIDMEDIVYSSNSRRLSFRLSTSYLSPSISFYYHYWIEPLLNRISAILLYALSFIIIESEFFHSTKLSLINVIIFQLFGKISTLQFVTAIVFLSYMCISSLTSLTKIKVFNMYHLVSFSSDPVSACFYAMYASRLTIPLSYNFLTLFVSRDSQFEDFFGKSIHLTGLFNLLNNWLPRLLLIPIFLTVFHVYDKVKKMTGFDFDWDSFDDEDAEQDSMFARRAPPGEDMESRAATNFGNTGNRKNELIVQEAKRIIDMELNRKENNNFSGLRSFNLNGSANGAGGSLEQDISRLADINYQNNRNSFHASLLRDTTSRGRIDDYDDNDSLLTNEALNSEGGLNTRSVIDGTTEFLNGLRNGFLGRFQRRVRMEDERGAEEGPLVL